MKLLFYGEYVYIEQLEEKILYKDLLIFVKNKRKKLVYRTNGKYIKFLSTYEFEMLSEVFNVKVVIL